MKTSESLFFSQAINACLSVAKSLGASDAQAYELAVSATTESFAKKNLKQSLNLQFFQMLFIALFVMKV